MRIVQVRYSDPVVFCLMVLGLAVWPMAGRAAASEATTGATMSEQNIVFPPCTAVVDVTKPPYFNEICYSGDPFAALIQETRDGVTRVVEREQGGIAPYISDR